MDRFELVEKLVKSTGVSYEDAKTALESSGWDLLDAAVWLEKNGKVESKTGHFSTNPEQQQEQEQQKQEQARREEPRGYARTGGDFRGGVLQSIFGKIRGILMDNELVICKQSGEIFLEIPVWLALVLLIVAFWPTLVVLILVFFLGFRFRLHGPDLGGERVNRVLNQVEKACGDAIDKLKSQHNTRGSATGSRGSSPVHDDNVIDYEDPDRKE